MRAKFIKENANSKDNTKNLKLATTIKSILENEYNIYVKQPSIYSFTEVVYLYIYPLCKKDDRFGVSNVDSCISLEFNNEEIKLNGVYGQWLGEIKKQFPGGTYSQIKSVAGFDHLNYKLDMGDIPETIEQIMELKSLLKAGSSGAAKSQRDFYKGWVNPD